MTTAPACPQCTMENTYPDAGNQVCADCGHEWSMAAALDTDDSDETVVKDAGSFMLKACFLKKV